jgi:hypothetical protein
MMRRQRREIMIVSTKRSPAPEVPARGLVEVLQVAGPSGTHPAETSGTNVTHTGAQLHGRATFRLERGNS